MRSLSTTLFVAVLAMSGYSQIEIYLPDNQPAAGTCNAIPLGSLPYAYVGRVFATSLDPLNRRVDAVSFASCSTATFSSPTMQYGIGHLTAAAATGVNIALPTFDAAGNLTSLGAFADYTSLWNTFQNGPMFYPYVSGAWSPMPQAPVTPFVWNGVNDVGVFVMHQNSGGVSTFHRTSTEPYRWYSSIGYGATVTNGFGPNGLKMRLTCAPYQAGPTVTSVGSGCPGLNAMIPVLTTTELPSLGNVAFNVTVSNAPPGAAMLLYGSIGLAAGPIPVGAGCNVYLDPITLDILVNAAIFPIGPIVSDPFGVGGFGLPIPGDPGLANTHVGLQSIVVDAGAPLGITLTNALELVLN